LTAILAMMPKTSKHSIFCNHDGWSGCYFKWLLWLPARGHAFSLWDSIENIKQIAYDAVNFNTKVNLLKHLLQENEDSRVLIFVNNKKSRYASRSYWWRFWRSIWVIHSNKSQNYRLRRLPSRKGICEDLLLQTLWPGVRHFITHVINFEMPAMPELYMHRIGRTVVPIKREQQLVSLHQERKKQKWKLKS
jgi:ATP-dependent RNA helicase RhlE